jgi:hypothetical protein
MVWQLDVPNHDMINSGQGKKQELQLIHGCNLQ